MARDFSRRHKSCVVCLKPRLFSFHLHSNPSKHQFHHTFLVISVCQNMQNGTWLNVKFRLKVKFQVWTILIVCLNWMWRVVASVNGDGSEWCSDSCKHRNGRHLASVKLFLIVKNVSISNAYFAIFAIHFAKSSVTQVISNPEIFISDTKTTKKGKFIEKSLSEMCVSVIFLIPDFTSRLTVAILSWLFWI